MNYVDIDKKLYRESSSFFGFEIPRGWVKLPEIEYISVFRASIKSSLFSRSGERTSHTKELQVNFIYDKNKKITAFIAKDKEEAITKAKEYATKLDGLKILDATQKPFEWINK